LGAYQFPGYNDYVEDISGGSNTHDINHFLVHYEQCSTAELFSGGGQVNDAIRVQDAQNVLFAGIQVSQANGTAAFHLSNSAYADDNIHVVGFTSQSNQGTTNTFINNLIRPSDNTDFEVTVSGGDYNYLKNNGTYGAAITDNAQIFSASGNMLSNPHTTIFSGTLSGGSPGTATISLVAPSSFTSASTYLCTVTNNSNTTDVLKIVTPYTNGTTFVVNGPNGSAANFSGICSGN
jgi:hypothetical protein